MSSYCDAAAIRRDIAELLRPPRRVKVSEACAESMYVVHGNGARTLWDPQRTPYIVEPMDCMGSRLYHTVVFVGPSRTGKTLGLVDGYICHKIMNDPGDGLLCQITEEKSREHSKKRLDRTFEASPRILERLSPRAHDNNVHDKIFRAGNYLAIKWPSKNVFASSDYQFVLLTDYDRMPPDIGGEGSPYVMARKRTQTFGSTGMTLVDSSPGRPLKEPDWRQPEDEPHRAPPTTGILDIYNQGDRRRLYWPCPHCAQWFMPVLENFHLESARPFCPHCGVELAPGDKRRLNAGSKWVPEGCSLNEDGELVGTPRHTGIASFWMEGPAAAYQSWESLRDNLTAAEKTYQETGDQEDLKTVTNTDWCRPYANRVAATTRSSAQLMDRAEQTERRTVPNGVRFLIATVDVQGGEHRRFVVQIHGVGAGRETWVVDRFNIAEDRGPDNQDEPRQINPATQPEDWNLLTRDVLQRSYRLADGSGRRMSIVAVGVDTGGEGKGAESVTAQAYDWYRRLSQIGLHGRVFLMKGGSTKTSNRVRKTWPDNTGRKSRKSGARGDVPIYILGTDLLKDAVAGMMDRDNPGAAYLHTPNWLGRWWFEEMTAEQRDPATGKWSRPGKRPNEAFDLVAYALAVLIIIGAEKINWSRPPAWADAWDKNVLIYDPAKAQEAPQKHAMKPQRRRRRIVKSKL